MILVDRPAIAIYGRHVPYRVNYHLAVNGKVSQWPNAHVWIEKDVLAKAPSTRRYATLRLWTAAQPSPIPR